MATDDESFDLGPEIEAMSAVHIALKALPAPSQQRVVRWAMGAYGVQEAVRSQEAVKASAPAPAGAAEGSTPPQAHSAFADLFGDASPTTDADKALVGGYWLQVILGHEDFASQSVNEELKNTGNAIGNITRAFDNLRSTKPQLVRQLMKSGKSQQARKRLKLTTAGVERVRQMLIEQAG